MSALKSLSKPLFLFALLATASVPISAKADVFVWQNQDKDVSLAFPDRWGLVGHQADDEILRIAAPVVTGVTEGAECRMRIRDDGRFKIHPVSHDDELQRQYYSLNFWKGYAGEYRAAKINTVTDNGQLGRGFASYADITFEPHAGEKMIRRGIAFATLYKNQVHVFECSAEESAYMKWKPSFMGIIKSVEFNRHTPDHKRGFYRDLYAGRTVIENHDALDAYTF